MGDTTPEAASSPPPEPMTYSLPEELRFFRGDGGDHRLEGLPLAPPWRRFKPLSKEDRQSRKPRGAKLRYKTDGEATELVNIALLLRRPLLVTGKPGIGKSSLAYAIAHELKLGKVLVWPITSRSTLQQGLYNYDAVGRLQEVAARNASLGVSTGDAPRPSYDASDAAKEIGRYIRLGPLGTALLPWRRPRVLLIDEIDKSDIDLPNDLLHVFEEGEYEIPELARLPAQKEGKPLPIEVWRHKSRKTTRILRGHVRCKAFPLVILTSNGEREFPPAFLRRCLRLDLKQPGPDELAEIVRSNLETKEDDKDVKMLVTHFDNQIKGEQDGIKKELTTDQLLNAVYLLTNKVNVLQHETLKKAILRSLSGG